MLDNLHEDRWKDSTEIWIFSILLFSVSIFNIINKTNWIFTHVRNNVQRYIVQNFLKIDQAVRIR